MSCDSHYLVLLAALIKSIEINKLAQEKLHFYVVEKGISHPEKQKLLESVNLKHIRVTWLKMRDVIPVGMKLPLDKSSYPLNIYIRLFVPFFVPEGVEKVLYLDVDMLVLNDITKIFEIELGDNLVGAVADPRIQTFDNPWGGVSNYRELGISGDTRYFNTGLLLLNIPLWKEHRITEKIIECIEQNAWVAKYPDQYGLNVILAKKWLEISPLWNHFAHEGGVQPNIIHFTERKPIFNSYNNDKEYQELFFKYLRLTQWADFKTINEARRYSKKLQNVLGKFKLLIKRSNTYFL